MRSLYRFVAIISLTGVVTSCGSGDSGSSNGGGNPNNGVGTNLDDLSCPELWLAYQKAHPKGRKLTFEGINGQKFEKTENLITFSDNAGFTEQITVSSSESVNSGSSSTSYSYLKSETKQNFLPECEKARKSGADPMHFRLPRDVARYENKTTRAGTFNTRLLHVSSKFTSGGIESTTESDIWTNNNALDSFNVFEKSISTSNGQTKEKTTELVSIINP
jgi:hypothetical protein